MSKNKEEFSRYFGIKTDANGFQKIALKSSQEAVQEWAASLDSESSKKEPKGRRAAEEGDDKEESLEALMERFSDTMMSYYSLIDTAFHIPSVLLYAHVQMEMVKPITANATCLKDDEELQIYGLGASDAARLAKASVKLMRMKNGTAALPSSTLLSLVAAFDSMISDLVAFMLKNKKEKLQLSEKSVSISEILSATSIDELLDKFVSDQVYELLRGSHDEQVAFIEKAFDVNVRADWASWPDFIELFERRNLIAHGEAFYTKRYVDICTRHGKAKNIGRVGAKLELEEEYLLEGADTLLEFFILMTFSLWRKHFKDSTEFAFNALNDSGFKLIVEGRLRAADNILGYGLSLKDSRCTEVARRMMTINRANALKTMGDSQAAGKVLASMEWNAAADNFQICEAAVRDDIESVVAKLEIIHKAGSISATDFREWPVFESVRSDEKFQAEFERVFQEPLLGVQKGAMEAEVRDVTSESGEALAKSSEVSANSKAVH